MVTVMDGDPAVVRLAGELDIAGVPLLTAALAQHGGDVELHCSRLTFLAAAGVNAFVVAHQAYAERGSKLIIVDPSRAVLRVLRLVDLETYLNIRHDGSSP